MVSLYVLQQLYVCHGMCYNTRSACRDVHFLLQVLTLSKNAEWEADLGAAGRTALCSVGLLLLIPRDSPGGNRASRVSSGEQNFHIAQGWVRKGSTRVCFVSCSVTLLHH